jgi:hypothetical protein
MLNTSLEDIAGMLRTASFMINNQTPSVKVIDFALKKYKTQSKNNSTKALYLLVQDLVTMSSDNFNYDIDRVNNTADLDGYITMLARDKGFDSVQFTMAANGNGGWAHEIVWVQFEQLVKQNENTWKGWDEMEDDIYCDRIDQDGMLLCQKQRDLQKCFDNVVQPNKPKPYA